MCLIEACLEVQRLAEKMAEPEPVVPCTLCKPDDPCFWHRQQPNGGNTHA